MPFCLYADSEAVLEPTTHGQNVKGAFNKHKICAIGFYFHSNFDNIIPSKYMSYRGANADMWSAREMEKLINEINFALKNINNPPLLTPQEYEDFKNSTTCYLCKNGFSPENPKIIEHCHLSGKFRGNSCTKCNLKLRKQYLLPIIFHCFSSYDSHLVIHDISKAIRGKISVLAKNSETYLNMKIKVPKTKVHLNFIDSFHFLSSSLDTLASYLPDQHKEI